MLQEIGYPIIGEISKNASNVIDYNINEEITVNTNSATNANNDTTTGLATLSYGVNAPKIIENISIVKGISKTAYVEATQTIASVSADAGENPSFTLSSFVLSNDSGDYKYASTVGKGIQIPVNGLYQIYIEYPIANVSSAYWTTELKTKENSAQSNLIYSYVGTPGNHQDSETLQFFLKGGAYLFAIIRLTNPYAVSLYNIRTFMKITKLQ